MSENPQKEEKERPSAALDKVNVVPLKVQVKAKVQRFLDRLN